MTWLPSRSLRAQLPSGTFALTPEITAQTNREACALGAEVVSLGGVNQGEFFAASFYALQRKGGQAKPAPAPTPTTPL